MDTYTLALKVGIPVKDLTDILLTLVNKKVSVPDFIKTTGMSKETVKKLRTELVAYFEPIPNFFVLNEKGNKFLSSLSQKRFEFSSEDAVRIRAIFDKYNEIRPKPKREYDQFYSTSETQVARVKLLSEQNDLENCEVLFLGDDDITSVCLAVLGIAKRVAVVDIDQAQLSFISQIAKEERLKIELYHYDLRKKLPDELKAKFDIVFTDPPYTPNGFKTFLQRQIEAQKGTFGTIYICYGTSERSLERILPIQAIINEYDLVISHVFKNFNRYTGAESIGSSSNLYVLRTTKHSKPKKLDVGRFYTYE